MDGSKGSNRINGPGFPAVPGDMLTQRLLHTQDAVMRTVITEAWHLNTHRCIQICCIYKTASIKLFFFVHCNYKTAVIQTSRQKYFMWQRMCFSSHGKEWQNWENLCSLNAELSAIISAVLSTGKSTITGLWFVMRHSSYQSHSLG